MKVLAPREKNANKGDFGTVLIIGGAPGMAGAPLMAAQSALRTGAGKAIIATDPSHAAGLITSFPNIMCFGVRDALEIQALFKLATHIVVGPGLGQTKWSHELLTAVLALRLPMVVDADALNILAKQPITREHWILTPHVGEAARLLDSSIDDINADRESAIITLQKKYGGVIVLKGAGTLITDKNHQPVKCHAGNPGMASAGMGDILSGVIAALMAQGLSLVDAAELGVNIHAKAGDLAAIDGMRGMIATDLLPFIRQLANG
jgi:NAD(P)H-hydrate epimerase